ncbi:Uncharacterised protein [Mycobacteroides abscessus subsp. abscessus]|nr:Uncharacterised protein [Mycobacteroides abscessus subsp. abscessus]
MLLGEGVGNVADNGSQGGGCDAEGSGEFGVFVGAAES